MPIDVLLRWNKNWKRSCATWRSCATSCGSGTHVRAALLLRVRPQAVAAAVPVRRQAPVSPGVQARVASPVSSNHHRLLRVEALRQRLIVGLAGRRLRDRLMKNKRRPRRPRTNAAAEHPDAAITAKATQPGSNPNASLLFSRPQSKAEMRRVIVARRKKTTSSLLRTSFLLQTSCPSRISCLCQSRRELLPRPPRLRVSLLPSPSLPS